MEERKKLLKTLTESLCVAMRLAYEKANADVSDPDLATKAELCFFILYLIFDGGAFDEAEPELFEEAADYEVNRDNWYQIMEVGRVDSDEHYLTQPPEVFKFMQELDNVLYDIGENFACVDTIVAAYQGVGDIYVYLDCNGNTRFYSASGRCNGKSEQGNMELPYGLITEEMRSKTLWEDGVKDILSIYFFQ